MLVLARWARRLSCKETAEAFRTSWDEVFDAVEHVVSWGVEHRTLGQIDAIGLDEIQYSKGHKYLTLVYQIDLGVTRLLWVGKERTIESFRGFFTTIGEEVTSKIVFICSDMWEPYLKVIRDKCSQDLHILAPHGERRPETATEEVALAPARCELSRLAIGILESAGLLESASGFLQAVECLITARSVEPETAAYPRSDMSQNPRGPRSKLPPTIPA